MAASAFWPQPCSLTAVKYQKYGAVEMKPFLPGERFSVAREMERNVKGYRDVSKELAVARKTLEHQKRSRSGASMDRAVRTSYYKSVVGTR